MKYTLILMLLVALLISASAIAQDKKSGNESFTLADNTFKVGQVYTPLGIYWHFDQIKLREESNLLLDSIVSFLQKNNDLVVAVGSHTDSRGSAEYNIMLSQKRAEYLVKYLKKQGLPSDRLMAKGYGESKTLDDCSRYPECQDNQDCTCRQANRRTEIEIVAINN